MFSAVYDRMLHFHGLDLKSLLLDEYFGYMKRKHMTILQLDLNSHHPCSGTTWNRRRCSSWHETRFPSYISNVCRSRTKKIDQYLVEPNFGSNLEDSFRQIHISSAYGHYDLIRHLTRTLLSSDCKINGVYNLTFSIVDFRQDFYLLRSVRGYNSRIIMLYWHTHDLLDIY